MPQGGALHVNCPVLRGGGLPLADNDAGALNFLHERVPVGELLGREGVRLNIDKLLLNNGVADKAHILKPKPSELVGYQGHVNI